MAATLNKNANSLAAANWSDATGFADNAELVIADGTVDIDTALDQSGLTAGISYLIIRASYRANVGSAGTPLECDVDGTDPTDTFAAPTLAMFAPTSLYYQASGGNNVCDNLVQAGSGRVFLEGGTITNLRQASGRVDVNASTVVTNANITGGRCEFAYNATNFTDLTVRGGNVITKRGGTMIVRAGTLVVDVDLASPTLSITVERGAQLIVRDGAAIATLTNYGVADLRQAKRPVTITTLNRGPTSRLLVGDASLTITTDNKVFGFYDAGDPGVGSI